MTVNTVKQVRKKFKSQITKYQKKLERWKEKDIKSGSKEEILFSRFLKKILYFELPPEILPTFPEFALWMALKLEAQQILGNC